MSEADPSSEGRWPAMPPFWTILAFWTFVAVIAAAHAAPHHDSMAGAVAYELINHWAWAAVTPVIFLLGRRFPMDRAPRGGAFVVHILAGIVVGIAWGTFSELVHAHVGHPGEPSPTPLSALANNATFGFSSGLVVYFAILAAAHAFRYYGQALERQQEALGLRTQLAEARLHGLRMQLQPHFLFNTLNTVSGLAESDPGTTRKVVARLSDLLRHTLEAPDRSEIALAEEAKLLDRYLDIVRARFGDRVTIEVHVDPATREARVPPLCLQPLVENAVEHGVGRTPEGGTIRVTSRLSGDALILDVWDDGPGREPVRDRESGLGVGIRNVRERLEQLHGGSASVTLASAPDSGTVARVTLPFRTIDRSSGAGA